MIVFALTQTVLAALVQPLFDDVLAPPARARRWSRTRAIATAEAA